MNPIRYFVKRWTDPAHVIKAITAGNQRERYRERYLSSPRWVFVVRPLAMIFGFGICHGCWREPASDVHHLNYNFRGAPGLWGILNEAWYTEPLCRACHRKEHP